MGQFVINSCKNESNTSANLLSHINYPCARLEETLDTSRINSRIFHELLWQCDDFVTSSRSVTVFVTFYFIRIQQIILECDEVTRFSTLSCPRARARTHSFLSFCRSKYTKCLWNHADSGVKSARQPPWWVILMLFLPYIINYTLSARRFATLDTSRIVP